MKTLALWIDTTAEQSLTVGVVRDRAWVAHRTVPAYRAQAEKLLPTILQLLRKVGAGLPSLERIVVARGPGPFTGVRIGVVTANTLAYALGIPVAGVASPSAEPAALLAQVVRGARGRRSVRPVEPLYGAEPNITHSSRRA